MTRWSARPRAGRRTRAVALLLVLAAGLLLLSAPAQAADEARVRVREVDGRDVTLDISPPASFGRTVLPASAFRVQEGDEQRRAAVRRLDDDDLEVVVVVDPLLDDTALATVRASLVQFVRELPRGARVGVVVAGDPLEVVPLSDDPAAVIEALVGVRHVRRGSLEGALLRALDVLPDRPQRGVVVAVNSGHFERPGPRSDALERRLAPGTPVAAHIVDLRQAAFGLADVPPPGWVRAAGRYTVVERPTEVPPALDDISRELANAYEVRTTVQGGGSPVLSIEIAAGGRQAAALTIVDLPDPPKPPLPVDRRDGWVVPLLVGLAAGLVALGVLLYVPRRRRRRRLSAELRLASGRRPAPGEGTGTSTPPPGTAPTPPSRAPALAAAVAAGGGPAPGVPSDATTGGVGTRRAAPEGDDGGEGAALVRAAARATSRLGGEQVEGVASVAGLLRGGRRVRKVVVGPGLTDEERDELLALAARRRVRVTMSSVDALRAAASSPGPGAVAWAAPLRPARLEHLCLPVAGRAAVVLGVPGDVDDEELGALLREGERAGLSGVLLRHRTGPVVTPQVARLAAGAVERVPIALAHDLGPAAARLRADGALLLGIDRAGSPVHALSEALEREPVDRPVVVLLGGRDGLGRHLAHRCHIVAAVGPEGPAGDWRLLAQWRRCAGLLERRRLGGGDAAGG